MCVLAILLEPGRILAAANRDEAFDRPSAPPAEVEPGIIAGRDLLAGGAWLGFNRRGLFVAVTNRKTPPSTPAAFSRGLMVREALRQGDLDGLRAMVERRVGESPVAGFNLLAVVDGRALALLWDGRLRTVELGLGAHVVS